MMPRILWAFAAVATSSGTACGGGVPVPNDQWAAAQEDVGRAQAGGAPDVPQARLHLQIAQEDLQQAHRLMGNDNRRAASLCAVARAEAQLASSLAKQVRAEEAARRALADLQQRGSTMRQAPSPEPSGARMDRPNGSASGAK